MKYVRLAAFEIAISFIQGTALYPNLYWINKISLREHLQEDDSKKNIEHNQYNVNISPFYNFLVILWLSNLLLLLLRF